MVILDQHTLHTQVVRLPPEKQGTEFREESCERRKTQLLSFPSLIYLGTPTPSSRTSFAGLLVIERRLWPRTWLFRTTSLRTRAFLLIFGVSRVFNHWFLAGNFGQTSEKLVKTSPPAAAPPLSGLPSTPSPLSIFFHTTTRHKMKEIQEYCAFIVQSPCGLESWFPINTFVPTPPSRSWLWAGSLSPGRKLITEERERRL